MFAPIVAAVMLQVPVDVELLDAGVEPATAETEGAPALSDPAAAQTEPAAAGLSSNDGARFGVTLVGAMYGLSIAGAVGAVASLVSALLFAKVERLPGFDVILAVGLVASGVVAPFSIPLVAKSQHKSEGGRGTTGAALMGSVLGCAGAAGLGVGAWMLRDQPVVAGLMIALGIVNLLFAPATALELTHAIRSRASFAIVPLRDGAAASVAVRF